MSVSEIEYPRALVIGYGNPLRGDDAAGWIVAERVADEVDAERVASIGVHQLTPELAQPVSRMDVVVFVDASHGSRPGEIQIMDLESLPTCDPPSITHGLTPQRVLWLARCLYGRSPGRAHLLSVVGADFGHTEELSPPVELACQSLVTQVLLIVEPVVQHA